MSKISPMTRMSATGVSSRTVSADPGLLSNEELLERNKGRRRTLEELIAKEQMKRFISTKEKASILFKKAKKRVRWFIDHAQLKISVSCAPNFRSIEYMSFSSMSQIHMHYSV